MTNNRLTECDYCGGVRLYDPAKSCPGCGAPLPKPKVEPRADWQRRNDGLAYQDMMRQMQGQMNMNTAVQCGRQQRQQQIGGPLGYQPGRSLSWGAKGGW